MLDKEGDGENELGEGGPMLNVQEEQIEGVAFPKSKFGRSILGKYLSDLNHSIRSGYISMRRIASDFISLLIGH